MIVSRVAAMVILIAGLLCVSGTHAEAQTISGFRLSGINSIEVESILQKLKNTDATKPVYEVVMFPTSATFFCTSPGGGTGGVGVVFNPDLGLVEVDVPNQGTISKNGRYLSEIVFHDDFMIEQLLSQVPYPCPNTNWTLGDRIVINNMEVFGTLFSCSGISDEDYNDPFLDPREHPDCLRTDAVGEACVVPAGVDATVPGTEFEYSCRTVCDGISGSGACPLEPVFIGDPTTVYLGL